MTVGKEKTEKERKRPKKQFVKKKFLSFIIQFTFFNAVNGYLPSLLDKTAAQMALD